MTRDIYCFHIDFANDDLNATLPLWLSVWAKHGWTPRVLGLDDAKLHPDFQRVYERAESFPTYNFRGFSTANFIRWCAFAQVDGAVADYDVFPRVAYPPQEYPGFTCADAAGGPGFIVGTGKDFDRIIQQILNYEPRPTDVHNGYPHVCDMHLLQNTCKPLYDTITSEIKCYGMEGWRNVPLVHFGNAYMSKTMPKAEEIKQVLKSEGAIYE